MDKRNQYKNLRIEGWRYIQNSSTVYKIRDGISFKGIEYNTPTVKNRFKIN